MQPSKSLRHSILVSLLLTAGAHAQDASVPEEAAPPVASQPLPTAEPGVAPTAPPEAAVAPPVASPAPASAPSPPPGAPSSNYVYQSWDLPPPAFAGDANRRRGHFPPPRLHAVEQREPRRYGESGAPFAFGVGAAYQFRGDRGYDRLGAEERQTELDLFASYDIAQPLPALIVAVGASYRRGSDGDDGDLTIARHALLGDVIVRYRLWRWLSPHARVAVGWQRHHAELKETGALSLEDNDNGVLGMFGAGFTVHTPNRAFETHRGRLASLSFGVLFEAGYSPTADAAFRLRSKGDREIPQHAASVGTLDASAGYLRVLAVTRF